MINKNKFQKELNSKGFVVLKGIVKKKTQKNIIEFANWYARKFITSWSNKKYSKVLFSEKTIYKKIIYYYLKFGKKKYRRNPKKNLANKLFYKIIDDPIFDEINKQMNSKKWYFSFIKNLRFKSKLLPWTLSDWHCDRFTFANFRDSDFKFLVIWIPLQKTDNQTGGGIEVVPKNIFSYNSLPKNYVNSSNGKKLFIVNKFKSKFTKTVVPKTQFGDMVIFDSSVIHRTTPAKTKSPFWSLDIRFEYGKKISYQTSKGGFNMKKNDNYKIKKLINSANLKFS